MSMQKAAPIPENHPVRHLFQKLADRALAQSSLPDLDLHFYLTDLLLDFMRVENLYRLTDEQGRPLLYLVDMFERAGSMSRRQKKACFKQIGDYTLFILGMFPESLSRGRRAIPESYYSEAGRRSYSVAAQLEGDAHATVVYRKLSHKFERCVLSLKWVREYTTDPFYQFMFRQFGLT